jgi:hypothetical protein
LNKYRVGTCPEKTFVTAVGIFSATGGFCMKHPCHGNKADAKRNTNKECRAPGAKEENLQALILG